MKSKKWFHILEQMKVNVLPLSTFYKNNSKNIKNGKLQKEKFSVLYIYRMKQPIDIQMSIYLNNKGKVV